MASGQLTTAQRHALTTLASNGPQVIHRKTAVSLIVNGYARQAITWPLPMKGVRVSITDAGRSVMYGS